MCIGLMLPTLDLVSSVSGPILRSSRRKSPCRAAWRGSYSLRQPQQGSLERIGRVERAWRQGNEISPLD